ncbi:Arylesterase precursor, partial [hydrothermal vent metagenome]
MANLKSWITYGFCFAILQLVIGCGQAPIDEKTSQVDIAQREDQIIAEPEADMFVLAFGDSLYAGYGLPPKEGFAPELEKALKTAGKDVKVHNAGVSGDTTAAGLRRMNFVLDSLPKAPDLVILGLGGNDLLRGLKPEETQANMEAMVKIIVDRNIP